ncbi:MAG: type II toxin-antitoxin system HicB family antitoxin [bacterium]|nr:type II toxin-antitoxin system HicB family antitoxin [bacterium]MDZ4296518.1 type II toxin-antitoxin system HicB family antitoxin [Patescibacteria group bacterium]
MKHYRFSVIMERDQNGYFVFCPELQGCYSQGDTYEEALENIRDAIQLHVADRAARREPIHQPDAVTLATLEIPA